MFSEAPILALREWGAIARCSWMDADLEVSSSVTFENSGILGHAGGRSFWAPQIRAESEERYGVLGTIKPGHTPPTWVGVSVAAPVRASGPLMTHLTPHDFLRQSLGQRQRLSGNLALRQCLLELLDAFVGDLHALEDTALGARSVL